MCPMYIDLMDQSHFGEAVFSAFFGQILLLFYFQISNNTEGYVSDALMRFVVNT